MALLDSVFDFNQHNRDRFIRDIASRTPTGAHVLDAGAGPCRYRPLFSHCRYEAQDSAKYSGTEHSYGNLDFVCDITSIPVAANTFDCVICTEVLEHVPYPDRAIAELARILKPGGILAITAPLMSGIHMGPYHYYSGFTPYWYEYFLPANGVMIENCRANGGFFMFYGQESRRFLSLMTPKNELLRLLFFPIKLVLAIWFRGVVPVACYFLDMVFSEPAFTVGYFVVARKTGGETTR